MSNTDWNLNSRPDPHAGSDALKDVGCQAGDLKGLLNAIVAQISEADRRQTDTLGQLQERLASMGRDAKSLRSRVPDQFQTAFERMEMGMAELAARIAEAGAQAAHFSGPGSSHDLPADTRTSMGDSRHEPLHAHVPPAAAAAPQNLHAAIAASMTDEPPVALRSAQTPEQSARRRDEPSSKPMPSFDTFDVIESLPGDVTDPWDRDAANALASVYDGEGPNFPAEPYSTGLNDTPRNYAQASQAANAAGHHAGSQQTGADHSWLEKRFSEISERIEASIAEICPDQSFFALGQRLDQFERSFAQAFDNVATHNDVESVRLIEAHMAELVGHLESTQDYLSRIETIELQLNTIAGRLEDVHALAELGTGDQAPAALAAVQPPIDVAALAKAAADEAAQRFANIALPAPVIPGLDSMHHLIERSMSDARASEENTTALLDTLQQAMIRLLDRMDAIEYNQHQSAQVSQPAVMPVQKQHAPGPMDYTRHEPRFEPQPQMRGRDQEHDVLDAAVAAVASHKGPQTQAYRPSPADDGDDHHDDMNAAPSPGSAAAQEPAAPQRQPDKLRQDFIADARRAKMRLANENDSGDAVIVAPPAREAGAGPASKPAPKVVKTPPPSAAPKAPAVSPRVVALSLALAVAGGAYLMLPFGKSANRAANTSAPTSMTQADVPAGPKHSVTESAGPASAPSKTSDATNDQAPALPSSDAPPPDADFDKPAAGPDGKATQLNMHRTEGHIVPDDGIAPVRAGQTSMPMQGIAVATDPAMTGAQWARAQRQNAMASVSTKLGQAAGDQASVAMAANETAAAISPAALSVDQPPSEAQMIAAKAGASGALDLPPATVGPLSLRLAAANGDPSAEFEVGARLAEGKGTDQNFKDAAKWYQRAAAKGFVQAQYRLGTLFERGLGMKADEQRAKDWYNRAAEQGNIKAMHNLAVLSANSRSGSPDYTVAAKWFTEAAERGLADSQFNLAVLHENGLGVTADTKEAFKWLSLAARGGDKEAVRRRDIMKGKLAAGELADAEAKVKAFHVRASDMLANDARTAGEAWKKNPANGESG